MYLVSFASLILQGPPNDPDGSGKVQGVIWIIFGLTKLLPNNSIKAFSF